MSKLFGQFSQETLESIASTQFKTIPTKKKDLVSELSAEAENAGVKELVFMLSNMELDDVCNRYLKVEHAPGNNTKAKMVLTKRLMESFEDKGLEDWFEACNDKAVLGALCEKLEISFNPKSSVETSKAAAIKEVRSYGAQILFSRLSLEQLKWCCEEMGLEGWETSNSKRALIAAIITQTAVVKAPAPKQKVITKKKPIEKCTTSDELYQHYSAKALEFWCEQNALKTYGTKKDLINRILEHLSGDKENVVVVPADKLPKVTKGKAAKAKKAVKADDEDMEDAEVVKPSSTRTRGKKPVAKSTDEEPAPKPKAKPVKGKKAAPVEEPADDESAEEPAEEPVKAAPKPKAKPVKGKKATRVEEPADEPVEEPVKEAPKPKAKPVKGKKATRVEEPADEPADDEPADEPVEEPVKEAPKPKAKPVKGKKAAPVVEAPVEEEPADEPADDVYDADAEQRAIDAERALRTNDESELDIQESESDEQCPKSLEGLIIHLHKACTLDIAKTAEAIKAAGGTHKASLSRSVNILVTSAKNLEKVKKQMTNIPTCRVVDESYLKNIL